MQKRLFSILLLLTSVTLLCGCDSGRPKLYPCKITVTQDGVPLADAKVVLHNISDENFGNTWAPIGMTDSNGVAVIRTNAQYPGAAAGKYRITVEKYEPEQSRLGPPPAPDTPAYARWEERVANEDLGQYSLIEVIYASPETPLEIEVGRGTNDKTIDVGKPVRIKL